MKKLYAFIALSLCACGGGGAASSTQRAAPSPAAANSPSAHPTLPAGCADASPCTLPAGTYVLGDSAVFPGLTLSVPTAGWKTTSGGADPGGFDLVPPNRPKDRLDIWTTADALNSSLTRNPDVTVVAGPASSTLGDGIKATALVVGVSSSMRYGAPACPASPTCADLFTKSFGLTCDQQLRVYLAAITVAGQPRTLLVAINAVNGASDLAALTTEASPILSSLRLPAGAQAA